MAAGNRISGKLGVVSIDGVAANFLHEWTLEWRREAAECSIKGEIAEQYTMGTFTGRITARRWSTNAANDSEFAALTVAQATIITTDTGGTVVSYILRQIVGSGQVITGEGVVVQGGLSSPREMAEDSLEIMLTTVPVLS